MGRRSVVLLTNPLGKLNATGEPVRADLWYGRSEHMYTCAVHTSNFVGTVHIEGSLAREPEDGDWFDIVAPMEYTPDPFIPDDEGGAKSTIFSFKGVFTWIRARMARPISEEEAPLDDPAGKLYGSVDRILLNM